MKKVKYFYSTKTQRFEPLQTPLWKKLLRIFGFISATLVTAGIIVSLAFKYLQSPNEKRMNLQLAFLQEKYDLLKKDIQEHREKVAELEKRDNEVYRVIFEAEQLPSEIRSGKILPNEDDFTKKLSPLNNDELITSIEQALTSLKNRIEAQSLSYDTLLLYISKKQSMLASIPSIQPVSNKDLQRIASGFGARIDPIYKIGKFHAGIDFTAPTGTPVYATGEGIVEVAEYNTTGYGNNIWIKHGFGYRTHYAHLVKIKTSTGRQVKRGEVIGWVGSTGKSTGPHLHYEVERRGEKIDPIHFFYNDIKAEDFERMVKISQTGNQSFD